MIEVQLNRDYYIKHTVIYNWCTEMFGPSYRPGELYRWSMSEAFGNQFYQFERDEDATLFTLKWKK